LGVFLYLILFIVMDCHYKNGDVIDVSSVEDMERIKDPNCIIEQGVILRLSIIENQHDDIVLNQPEVQQADNFSKEVSLDMNPQAAQAVEPQPVVQPPESIQQPAPEAVQPAPVVVQHVEPVAPVATTTEAPAAPFDINQIITSTGGGGGIAVILALIAVVGGTAGWKFWQKLSEQKHEQAMKKLELEAQAQGINGAQPPPCQAANAVLEAKLVAIEGKLASVEKKTSSFSAGFDAEDLEERLVKLEKKVKGTAGRPPKE